MARFKINVITAVVIVGLAASLLLLYRARASLRERDEQLQRLRDRMAQLEDDVARLSSTGPWGLTAEDRGAYLPLGYKEFDATPGSGHRRFRDQPRSLSQAGALVEEYLECHPELPFNQRMILHFHAAQLFAMGGMNERAVTHLDRARLPDGSRELGPDWNNLVDATKAFLLLDREGLVAARRRMAAGGGADEICDRLVERFGESFADAVRCEPVCSNVSVPADAVPEHRAAADRLAKALGLSVTIARTAAADVSVPSDCIWLEVRPRGGTTPDLDGYVILHGNKSTAITATSQRWLDAAVERFIETSQERNGKREAPFGLMTNFQLAR